MDLKGSLVDTNLRIVPSNKLLDYLKTITINDAVPVNIVKLVKGANYEVKYKEDSKPFALHLDEKDIENLNRIKELVDKTESIKEENEETHKEIENFNQIKEGEHKKESVEEEDDKTSTEIADYSEVEKTDSKEKVDSFVKDDPKNALNDKTNDKESKTESPLSLTTSDVDWLYAHLQNQRKRGVKDVPYLHALLEGATIEMPENSVIKRNPVLEARCVKLRAQQEAREYRKMTKTVDNVRMRFPEESISYQMKQLNRQLIVIGQFLLSIFAGFLFGFRGVEWMVGNLDFGFRLLLGVMCALIIALAEIYFIAKKLNEELNIPETIQLGGPPKFADSPKSYDYMPKATSKEATSQTIDKEHQD